MFVYTKAAPPNHIIKPTMIGKRGSQWLLYPLLMKYMTACTEKDTIKAMNKKSTISRG